MYIPFRIQWGPGCCCVTCCTGCTTGITVSPWLDVSQPDFEYLRIEGRYICNLYTHTRAHTHIHVHTCTHVHSHLHRSPHTGTCAQAPTHTYTHTHTHMCTHTCTHTHTHVHTHIHTHVCIQTYTVYTYNSKSLIHAPMLKGMTKELIHFLLKIHRNN